MSAEIGNIKTKLIGLNKSDVDLHLNGIIKEYKKILNDMLKEIKFLERTKSKLSSELDLVKSQDKEIIYENELEYNTELPHDEFVESANKRVIKTISLINEIADQKIESMVEKATVRLTEYDIELDRLKNEIEANREKIEHLLSDVMELLKSDPKDMAQKNDNAILIEDEYIENESKPFYFDIKKREQKAPTLVAKEVETTVVDNLKKYNDSRDEFAKKLEDVLISIDFKEPVGAVLILQINEFIMANYFLDCKTGDVLTDNIINYIKNNSNNVYAQRLSYDQIGIIYNGISDIYRISQFTKNILNYVQNGIFIDGKKIDLSANIGIAIYSKTYNNADVIMNYAGIALYKAKEQGKGQYQFIDDEFISKVKYINSLKVDLMKAIKNDELALHYQPQFSVENKELMGFEALLRWQNDKYNKTSIFDVIKIAEKENLIDEIGFYLFKKACYFAKEVENRSDKKIIVSVNFSSIQIARKDFIRVIEKIIEETDVSPNYLGFEITESCFIDNFEETANKLQQIKNMGITISIDDFGTGYSTLSYLLKLPVSLIKIDKSFLEDLTISSKTETFINSIINITHNLGLKVVAEGVENEQQYDILENLGCDYIQGYLLAKPVPENEAYMYII